MPVQIKLGSFFNRHFNGFWCNFSVPNAMCDEKSVYPKEETVFAFILDVKDEVVGKGKNLTFTQSSAILNVLY